MAEKRKLLQEVEKTYKKVDEGIEIFEEIMTKMYEANSENQRDKFQEDLKREIKKLQRLRDLIKGWQLSSDIKDKDKLHQYRKLIESKMEQFKDIERENKTKPHSKQGLSAEEKLDPREKEKMETIDWLRNKIRLIQDDVDRTEVKIEAVGNVGSGRKRKGKDDSNKEKLDELRKHLERLRYHTTNLEVCMRLVTNDEKEPKEVMDVLQDALDPFVEALDIDSDMNPKELDPYGVYEELDLSEYVQQLAGVTTTSIDEEKDDLGSGSENNSPVQLEDRVRNPSSEKAPAPIAMKSISRLASNQPTSEERVSVTSPPPAPTPPPTIPYNAVAAGFLLKSPASVSTPTPATPVLETESRATPAPATPTTAPDPLPALVAPVPIPAPVLVAAASSPIVPLAPSVASTPASLEPEVVSTPASTATAVEPNADEALLRELASLNTNSTAETQASDIPAWLGVSPLGRVQLNPEQEKLISRLEEASKTMPHRFDSEPQRPQMPRIPYTGFASYPQMQNPLFQSVDYYMRLHPETLLFIFYYMEGSKAQLLAAQALKKLSWRFHTKYLMWFQRHEEPKVITDDYEQGSYVYFDFERWAQRKKDVFMFEYRYLEDRDLTSLM